MGEHAPTEQEKRERFFEAFAEAIHAGARVVESRHAIAWIVLRPTEWSPQWSVFCPVGESAAVLKAIDEARERAGRA